MVATLLGAARQLDIDRGTVRRYVRKEPSIMEGNKVNIGRLRAVIEYCKTLEGRGYPLGRRRDRWLPLGNQKKAKPIVRKTVAQRLAIIAREIDAMNDAEQVQVLRMGRETYWDCFRSSSFRQLIAQAETSPRST